MALPYHLLIATDRLMDPRWSETAWLWVAAGLAGGLLLGSVAVLLPLRMGAGALRRMEF
jgi:hypothetical protein